MKVLVTGAAGKLGCMLAARMVRLGHTVYLRDKNVDALMALRKERPVHHDYDPAVCSTELYAEGDVIDIELIVVATPSLPDGRFDMTQVNEVLKEPVLWQQVLVSTVNPGDTPMDVIYMPTMIALGEMDFTRYIFAGVSTERQKELITQLWGTIHPVRFMTQREAELVKLGINCYLTTKISFANAMGTVAKSFGANPDVVCEAIGADYRVGSAFMKPGLPFGGPCLPRDTQAMIAATALIKSQRLTLTMELNNNENECVILNLAREATDARTIGIIGMSYKHGVPYDTDSVGKMLEQTLRQLYPTKPVYTLCPWCKDHTDFRAVTADKVYSFFGAKGYYVNG